MVWTFKPTEEATLVDAEANKSSIPTIFAGGDVAPTGESNAINAMGAGKKRQKQLTKCLNN